MNRATKTIELPALTVDLLKANGVLIDNVFASLWREVGMKTILNRAGFNKRSGTPMSDVMFSLMLWLWLQKESIGMFARKCLQGAMGKDNGMDSSPSQRHRDVPKWESKTPP